jgi:hypothetical protein
MLGPVPHCSDKKAIASPHGEAPGGDAAAAQPLRVAVGAAPAALAETGSVLIENYSDYLLQKSTLRKTPSHA